MIVDRQDRFSRAPVSRSELGLNLAIAAIGLALLGVSLWTVFETSSGALVLAWTGA